jgi:7-cyano-7-deazaguanine synthase
LTKGDQPKALVLLSGGIDSTACVAFYLQQGFSVSAVFVDYGQIAAPQEKKASQAVANHYQIPVAILSWSGQKKQAGLIIGRNAFLLFAALMEVPVEARIIAAGIHSGTTYYDCSQSFIRRIQFLFDSYTGGIVQVGTPFLKWSKRDVWAYCKTHRVPLELTYSCENGSAQPCGECLSCQDLEILHACP